MSVPTGSRTWAAATHYVAPGPVAQDRCARPSAQRFALDHADRTLGVVLIGSFHAFHDNPGVLELQEAIAQLTHPIDYEFVREFQESCVA